MLSNQMKDKDMSFLARAMGDGYADVTGDRKSVV